jgi:hypothetical protein
MNSVCIGIQWIIILRPYLKSRVLNSLGGLLVTVPKIGVGANALSLIIRNISIDYISMQQPNFRFYHSAEGAIKFDIGTGNKGVSEVILEDFLVPVGTAVITTTKPSTFPRVVLNKTSINFRDEASGVRVQISEVNVEIHPDIHGVRSKYKFEIALGDDALKFTEDSLYRIAGQGIELNLYLYRVVPGMLAEYSPKISYLAPFYVPAPGEIKIQLNQFLDIQTAEFDLYGEAGSLVHSDYSGINLQISSIHTTGRVLHAAKDFEVDMMAVYLADAKVSLSGEFINCGGTINMVTDISLTESTLAALMPGWFKHLEHTLVETGEVLSIATSLSFNGNYDIPSTIIDGRVVITKKSGVLKWIGSDVVSEKIGSSTLMFSINGSIYEPIDFLVVPSDKVYQLNLETQFNDDLHIINWR